MKNKYKISGKFNNVRSVLFICLCSFFLIAQLFPIDRQVQTIFQGEENRPLVIAHRGGAGIAPENTLVAFKLAEKIGVDAIELDVRMTKDEELVVIHDKTVDRTTNGTGFVNQYTLDEIKKLDAGYWMKSHSGKYMFRHLGITIPTLEEVFQTNHHTPLVIELKESNQIMEKKIASLIRKYNMENKVIIGSFNDESIKRFANQYMSQIPIGAGVKVISKFLILTFLKLDRLYPLDRQVVQLPLHVGSIDLTKKRYIKAFKKRNIAIHYWTINDIPTMKKLIHLNVDGIITDYPNRLFYLLANKDAC